MEKIVLLIAMTFGLCNCNFAQNVEDGILFPDGTNINKLDNGYEYVLPEGYSMWYLEGGSNAKVFAPNGTIRCDCEKGEGSCAPSYAKGTIGCYSYAENPCLECKSTVTESSASRKTLTGGVILFKSENIRESALAYHSDIYPADNIQEWLDAKWINSQTLRSIENDLNEVQNMAYEGSIESDQLVTLLMLSQNGKFTMDVPMRAIGGGSIYIGTLGSSGSFSCSGCEGKCVLKRKKLVIRYCDGCNSGCSLTFPDK